MQWESGARSVKDATPTKDNDKIVNMQSPHEQGLGVSHVLAFAGVINILQGRVLTSTIIFALVLAELGCLGITIGAHRLWSHRSFKANLKLKILLMACQTLSGQETVWNWAIWHRVHHKYVDTDADPHNSTRGFFYSHIGWILTFDHEKFRPYGRNVDMSDLMKDPVVMWQKRYIRPLEDVIVAFVMPAVFIWLCFNESLVNAFCVGTGLRVTYVMHRVFLINSAAHMWGVRPYDKKIYPTENKLVSLAICELLPRKRLSPELKELEIKFFMKARYSDKNIT
ncbi:unnamed protein product [Allacma fusca]|uniref:Fatty acid desaturase domain-containing protein n=1 Tax=Allacma fusca TaxID=39272 RepID=A0A8J2K3H1_9HEXA|nr:unnamed protein product [Allacma fusca]